MTGTDERWAEVNVLLEQVLSRQHPDPKVEAIILTAHLRLKVEGER